MNDLLLRAYHGVAARVRLVARKGGELGQTAAEYLGVLVLVAAIIVALVGSGIPAQIRTAATNAITNITNAQPAGQGGQQPGPQPT
jgi:hypothetical protein